MTERPPVAKLVAFWVVIALVPVVAFALLEGALRLVGYGRQIPLVVTKTIAGKELYVINREVGKRYFRAPGVTVPEPPEDTFEISKLKDGKRIFCLGESTMAGFPYEFAATAPSLLRERLRASFPGQPIEVVNVGISAVGTYVVSELVDELLDYEPDLFVLYVGHNEFYGAFGAASTVGIGGNPSLTRLYLKLTHLRSFVLLREIVEAARGLFSGPPEDLTGKTLMAEVIGEQAIPYGSDEYWSTIDAFEQNLRGILETCRRRSVPVVVSSLVSNVRDHAPFQSGFRIGLSSQDRAQWERIVASGDSAMARAEYGEAVRRFGAARAIDSTHALGLYKLAGALLKAGNVSEARPVFLAAKDYDLLRFRASEDLIARLRLVSRETSTALAPVDSAFESNSPGGLIGHELMMEHLHPTIGGYALMAEAFAGVMRRHGLVFGREAWVAAPAVPETAVLHRSAVSRFDTLVGLIKIELLTHRWPFVQETVPFVYEPKDAIEEIVYRYVQGRTAWSEARYELAEEYASAGRFAEARRECRAVANVIPHSYQPYLRIADYYGKEGKRQEALEAYDECTKVQDNPFSRIKRAVILLETERSREALSELHAALALPRSLEQLSALQLSLAQYLLGVAYAKLSDFGRARQSAQAALRYDPSSSEARDLLRQLDSIQGARR